MGRVGPGSVAEFIGRICSADKAARLSGMLSASEIGVSAVAPLGKVIGGDDPAAAKAATEALRRIMHHACRPGEDRDSKAASAELAKLIGPGNSVATRKEALNLLGMIGGAEYVRPVAAQLADSEVRDWARMSLERIPGRDSESVLRSALNTSDAGDRPAVEQSLRHKRSTMRSIGRGK